MYRCKSSKVVFDPYQVLPSFGENSIETVYKNFNLLLKIIYDDVNSEEQRLLEIAFEKVVFHKIESIPGVDGMDIEYNYGNNLSSLLEFTDSEFKTEWEKHFNYLFKLHHYKILFLSANKSLEVICEGLNVRS